MTGHRLLILVCFVWSMQVQQPPAVGQKRQEEKKTPTRTVKPETIPLALELPRPAFKGTPKHVPPGTNLEKPRKGPRPVFMAPKGTKNVKRASPKRPRSEKQLASDARLSEIMKARNAARSGKQAAKDA